MKLSSSAIVLGLVGTSNALQLNLNTKSMEKTASGCVAAGLVASSVIFGGASSAMAADNNDLTMPSMDFAGTTELIAGRSGGRAGGRASSGRTSSARPSARPSTTNVYVSPRGGGAYVAPPPVVVAPVISPFGYSPFGGLGYGALGAVNAVGNEIRDMNQEREIQRERAELDMAKQREAELEMRLRQLEMNQRAPPPLQVAPQQYAAPAPVQQ